MNEIDPVNLTAELIKCPSVTPKEAGAITLIEDLLNKNGFICSRISRGGVENLFARWGSGRAERSFGYNGHTDVVPVGNAESWSVDPFGAEVKDGYLFGRGATDMKSSVAAFVASAIDFVSKNPPNGSIVITITGDEEGEAKNGTAAILDWMQKNNEKISHCLVGEPTCPDYLGEMVKIGRRGSITARFCVKGLQGHTAYPQLAKNPLNALVQLMHSLSEESYASGESFLTPPGQLSDIICNSIEQELGVKPSLSTTGGTSDARFIKNICPVVEFGLVGKTMHAIDERVEISQIRNLKKVYTRILENYFAEI
ncbi:MAG: succinyl-diaminopimelate desuccinylase [Rhodobacterales bacterium]|nr:succinyl-diaminopimelate desuccinylase [Rhodobacterales bacterium]